jgi:uncharacterized protein (TIGR03435 family)
MGSLRIAGAACLAVLAAAAQSSEKMAFEVASVKPSTGPMPPNMALNTGNAKPRGGRFSGALTLQAFVSFAYKLNAEELQSSSAHWPSWVTTEWYTIVASAPGDPTKDQMRLMMQSLLADRFKLRSHFETKEVPVLALTLVAPGRTGPKLHPHAEGPPCPDSYIDKRPVNGEVWPQNCEATQTWDRNGMRLVGSRNITLASIADAIYQNGSVAREVDKPVLDRTGLIGKFDFTLEYAHDLGSDAPPGSVFLDEVREQLGFKLVTSRGPIRVLAIDHIERPPDN